MQNLLPSAHALCAVVAATLLAACSLHTPQAAAPATAPAATAAAIRAIPTLAADANLAPAELLARGLQHRTLGEYELAAADFYAITSGHASAPEARQARYFLAESFALRGLWSDAAVAMRSFRSDGVADDLSSRALFWLARCAEQAGGWAEAAALYEQYRALGTPLEPYARMRQAAQQQAAGQREAAAASYAAVAASGVARGERAGSHEKAIALYRELGQQDAALKLYADLLAFAEKSDYRLRILAEASALARQTGQAEQARAWERELIAQFPASAEALGAVATLQGDAGAALAPGDAARVYEAHEQTDQVVALLDAAIAQAAPADALDLRRRRAMALRTQGDLSGALGELAAISAADPNGEAGRQAQLDWVQTRGMGGETEAAIEGYRQYAQSYPDDARAPEALQRAALLLERLGDTEGALQQRLDLGRRYPAAQQGQSALDTAAMQLSQAGRAAEAQAAWESLAGASKGAVAARAWFWASRAAAAAGGDAASLLDKAAQAAPDAYYGVRAAEQRDSLPPASEPLTATTSAEQWREAESWVAQWSGKPVPAVDTDGYPAEFTASGPIARAVALADVGLYEDAINEWAEARLVWHDSPAMLYLTARYASEHDMPAAALRAAEDLAALAPEGSPPAPLAIRRLIFPTPYAETVIAQANEFDVDPRALYALLRQESHFDPDATSWVGARGLAQVMPETASGIAARLQVEDFHADDLYRPLVSIRFGAYYLSQQQRTMNGSLQGALAAYNGGPGNAIRWADGQDVADPEQFVESIDYSETEGYVKLVYGYYGAYRSIYHP